MQKRLLRFGFGGLIFAVVLGGVVLFLGYRPVAVSLAERRHDVPVKVFGLGTVEARVLSKVAFEVSGSLVELAADLGDVVAKGETLARLNSAKQGANVARAEAGVLSAEADLARAEASFEKARAVLAQAASTNRRMQTLLRRGTVSEETAEQAQRDEEVARGEVGVAQSEIEVARARLADARAQLDYERIVLSQHVLTAPFDAVVVERHKELGAVVGVGEPILTLVDPATVWALAYVNESRAGPIRLSQPAEVRLRSLPQELFAAHVARIGIESDRVSEERRVYVKCEQCPVQFHLGEQAEVLIEVARLDEALLVPEAAVEGFDGAGGYVWTVEDGALQRRKVTIGHRTAEGMVQITGGVPPGARVVSRIVGGLSEGRRAMVAEGDGG
jgi:HlyD family secretion protein